MENQGGDLLSAVAKTKPTNHSNEGGIVNFKWSQNVSRYGDKLLHRLDEFRKKSTFYDVVLKMNDGDLPAHKVVLIACGGVFRTQFVDPKTKMIHSNITEVPIKCPKVGIQPILNFAYSGCLQITESTLFPVLEASSLTEMKEVRDICVDIAKTRLSWLFVFDGTEKTCSCVNIENLKPSQPKKSLDLNEALSILFGLLHLNASNFSHSSDEITDTKEVEISKYPCLEVVDKEHPELANVYKQMIDCLRKAKIEGTPEKATTVTSTTKAKGETTQSKVVNPVEKEPAPEKKGKDEKPTVVTKDSGSDSNAVKVQQKVDKTEERGNVEISEPVGKDQSADNVPKITQPPQSKPRTTSLSTAAKTPPPPPSTKKAVQRHSPPQPIELPKPKAEPSDTKNKLGVANSKPVVPRSPVPAKRKSAAPKPPAHPPTPNNKTHHKPPPPAPPSNAKIASNRNSQKIPPPRPKPPSVKKKVVSPIDCYDDALNPFSFDDEPNDDVTASEDSYNSELNPFS